MIMEYTCIICPNGCNIVVEKGKDNILQVSGAVCDKGKEYVKQEIENPRRNITTSMLVEGGHLPLVSVRLSATIPKNRIFDVMEVIKSKKIDAPVHCEEILIHNILGLNCNVIATKQVNLSQNK